MMNQQNNPHVTTMINPDGTVTVRRKILNPDGSFTIQEEELPSGDQQEEDESPEVHLHDASDSVSSITDMKTTISASSSKDDVFAGIEDSPLRPKRQNEPSPEKASKLRTSTPPHNSDGNMHQWAPTAYQGVMPPAGEFNNETFVEQPRFQPNDASRHIAPPSPVYDDGFRHLRESGPLLDTPSVAQLDAPVTVTVFKKNMDDRIGINVGLSRVDHKDRLVVTKISPNGLLSDSAIEEGDVIMSINSHSFLDNPHTEDALAIVTQSLGIIAFEVLKRGKTNGERASSPARVRTTEKAMRGAGKVVTSEVLNEDGSLTIIVDEIDENGERIHREIRRERYNADNGEVLRPQFGADPSLLPAKMQLTEEDRYHFDDHRYMYQSTPVPEHSMQHSRRRKPPKQKKIVVNKTDKFQKLGIKLELHEGDTNILLVTGIHPSGLIAAAQSSLVVGDMIVSINGFDFMDNASLEIANTIIRNSTGEITLYAIDGEDDLDGFSKETSVTEPETPFSSSADFRNEMTFDEGSYGGSIGNYMASKVVRITKSDPSESIGLKLVQQRSHWGRMLVVLEVFGKAVQSGIEVGDAILAINGVNFRGKPDPLRAELVLRKATNVVVIEIQRLSGMNVALPAPRNKKAERPDKRAPEPKNSMDSRISKSIDQFDATFQTHMSLKSNEAVRSKRTVGPGQSNERTLPKTTPNNVDVLRPQFIPPKSKTIIVRVKKESPQQDVGLKVEAINGVLYVSKISLQGLLVGKSIVPGDIILSINNKWFLEYPSVADAEAQLRKPTKLFVIEVKKSPASPTGSDDKKLKWHERIQCNKRSGEDV
ncbi:unnamed protein product [Cylindrotheca closterium]|uniref:PDZ domain-containing protein n=1 Tax=Cylindrotheca closterium TaxID=2856 RepID=A0AAD2FF26_9STRA|nr:unnamed protein product [Cylindrotheca closterium]